MLSWCSYHKCHFYVFIGKIMIKKSYNARNIAVTIHASLGKVVKQLARAISVLYLKRGRDAVDINESPNECTITIGMTWHDVLIIIIYECIIMVVIMLVVKLFQHLCNSAGNKCIWGIKVMLYWKAQPNDYFVRIYIGTAMGYHVQFWLQGKLNRGDLEYQASALHDKIIFDWSEMEFKLKDCPISFQTTIQVL